MGGVSCRFTRTFGVIFSSLSLIVVGCASAVIVMCLVVLVKEFWVLGFVLIAMVLWQIIFVCAMGTAFESSCLWFSEGLYTMDWFLLAPKHRKYWRMLIQMAHRPHLVTLGSVWTANLNMFMVVRKEEWEEEEREGNEKDSIAGHATHVLYSDDALQDGRLREGAGGPED